MPRISKPVMTVILIAVCVGLIVGIQMIFATMRNPVHDAATARSKGNPSAPVKIIEFVDFQCPACGQGAAILKEALTQHGDKIYLQLKFFPLGGHAHGLLSAVYAQCAAEQGNFWAFHDFVFQRQAQWAGLINADPSFQQIAREIGLDIAELNACLTSEETTAEVMKTKEEGRKLGIKSTPTYFINDKMIVGTKTLKEEIDGAVSQNK